MLRKALGKTIFTLLFLITSFFASAQQIKLSGRVLNQKNEPLAGATITVSGFNKNFAADVEGRFTVTLEQGKKYSITVSAVSYQTKAVDEVIVTAEGDNVITIVMDVAAKTGSEIVIRSTARKENTSGLLNFQRNNVSLSSGLAADFIRRTPDKNMSEVLRRVSGASIQDNKFVIVRGLSDRYNQALINNAQLPSSEPDKKAFSFDVIPSQLIDNIIINKTATPDLTGEFAGGLVQINTKDIPAKNYVTVGFGLGFNTQSIGRDFISNERGKTDWLGFDDRRDIPASYPMKYGVYNTLPVQQRRNIAADFRDDVWGETQSTAGPIQTLNLTWGNAVRGKKGGTFGSIVGITYRNSKLLYTATKELYERGQNSQAFFDFTDNQNKYSTNIGSIVNLAWTKGKTKIAFKNLFNQLFEDNYYQRNGINTENLQDVQLRSSVLNQRTLFSSQLEGTHTLVSKIKFNWNLNYAFNHKEQPDLRVITYGRSIGTSNPFLVNLRGNNTNRFFSNLTDHAFGANGSLAYDFKIGEQKQTVKIGGNTTIRLRDFRATIFGYSEPTDQSLYSQPFNTIFSKQNFTKNNGFEMITALQNPQDKYYGISALSAGFVMFDNKIADNWRVIWGARVENFEQFLKSNQQGTEKAQIVLTKKLDFLPSANITYNAGKSNIRGAVSRTVARPEFREIAPFAFFDFETIASTAGNANLKRSSILNGDLRYEWYPKAGEVVSAGVFYKKFTDPIELRLNSASVATRRQYEFQNAASAQLYGAEVEFRKNLSFFNKSKLWLERLFFTGNVSVIYSEVLLANVDASGNALAPTQRPLQGQSPYLINAGFQYDSKAGSGFSALYNRIGQRLALVGNADFGDIYERPRHLLDLQFTQKILKRKGELRLTISDLLNQPIETYENRNTQKVFNSSIDKTFSSFKPGTTFTLGFTYDFDFKK
ncbi:MAG: carboxypeptidase regulatory-like domain-containing protein [Chitinophagaceae bacterium]|jgi:hypothetical protein